MKNKRLSVLLVLVLCIALTFTLVGCKKDKNEESGYLNPLTGIRTEEPIKAARPLQVSIDNVGSAIPQSYLSVADLVYEFPVEGNQTRLQAIFYGEIPDHFGPIRSVRPYFVDLAREYDSLFLGHGWSPDAKNYLLQGHVAYINAMNSDCAFYRVNDKDSPHDSYLDWTEVKRKIDENGWWDEKVEIKPFQFLEVSEDDKDKESAVEGKKATYITVYYGASNCEYTYDPETKLYTRTVEGSAYVDRETNESITVSNVLVQRVTSSVLDYKGRLGIDMCAGGNAVLYTNGIAIEGTWSRDSLDSRTVFVDKDGNEFKLQPGKTWVQVADQDCSVTHK